MFKVGSIVTWKPDGEKTIGTVTGFSNNSTNIFVNWDIANPKGYSHCGVSQNDIALYKFQIGDKVRWHDQSDNSRGTILKIEDNEFCRVDWRLSELRNSHEKLDNLVKIEDNEIMDETIKRLEAKLVEAQKEIETLKAQNKPKLSLANNKGVFLAKYKGTPLILVKINNEDRVYCFEVGSNPAYGNTGYFDSEYIIVRKLDDADLANMFGAIS